ncbi:MAG TPA: NAD(P)H-hydrate dehydratase [Pedococcus sp.]|nr:NAD(P)H-hydrate dehydratase [Pedococcus sp.]
MAAEAPTPITPRLLRGWALPEPGKDKEARGRTLVVGGTAHTPGAVLLSGEAILRAGAGKLQVATAEPVAAALAVAVPEALVVPLPTDAAGNLGLDAAEKVLELADGADTVLLGPGFSDVDRSVDLLRRVVPRLSCPVVLDALASAYLGADRDGVAHLAGRAILTVNPDELAKTLDVAPEKVQDDMVGAARRLAAQTSAVVLCGGQGKTIVNPDGHAWTSDTGGPGLGVSGSGDVQAGLVAGLLSRGAEPAQAACWGGHLHGSAGDVLAGRVGTVGFLAREIAGCVPDLLESLSA